MSTHEAVRVIGIGTPERGDDAAGLLALAALAQSPRRPGDWTLIEHRGDGLDLVARLRGAHKVILLDAVDLPGAPAGSVRLLDAEAVAAAGNELRVSSHALGVGAAVALARALGQCPPRLLFYGIVGTRFDIGAPVTPAVRAAAAPLARRILEEHATDHA